MAELFSFLLSVAVIGVGGIVWLVRLEGRVNHVEKDVEKVRAHVESLDSKIVNELAELNKAVARIEGYLRAKGSNLTEG